MRKQKCCDLKTSVNIHYILISACVTLMSHLNIGREFFCFEMLIFSLLIPFVKTLLLIEIVTRDNLAAQKNFIYSDS